MTLRIGPIAWPMPEPLALALNFARGSRLAAGAVGDSASQSWYS